MAVPSEVDFQAAIDGLDQRSLLVIMALMGKRAMDILEVHRKLEGKTSVVQTKPSGSSKE